MLCCAVLCCALNHQARGGAYTRCQCYSNTKQASDALAARLDSYCNCSLAWCPRHIRSMATAACARRHQMLSNVRCSSSRSAQRSTHRARHFLASAARARARARRRHRCDPRTKRGPAPLLVPGSLSRENRVRQRWRRLALAAAAAEEGKKCLARWVERWADRDGLERAFGNIWWRRAQAAVIIQRMWRGYQARLQFRRLFGV